MIQIDDTLISEDIIEAKFVCELNHCKGGCCIEGAAGAPLEASETTILDEVYPKVKPFLRPEGIDSIEKQGTHVTGMDGGLETPLVEGEECAYVIFNDKGWAQCGIEKAYNEGSIEWRKPISCHLYPVRIREYSQFTAVNYHKWVLCNCAVSNGNKLEVPIYRFVREALIRKFGAEWFKKLEIAANQLKKGD